MILEKDKYLMRLALKEASKAFDQGEFPVGCVIIFNDNVVAGGSRKGTASLMSDGSTSYSLHPSEIDHAEIRALKNLENKIVLSSTSFNNTNSSLNTNINLYDSPFDISNSITPEKCTLYCTMEPCLMCFGAIILSGIKRVVYAYEDPMGGGTSCDLSLLPPLYRESKITVVPYILREESLRLFARFFSKKENLYWKNSFLEKYTLEQAELIDKK